MGRSSQPQPYEHRSCIPATVRSSFATAAKVNVMGGLRTFAASWANVRSAQEAISENLSARAPVALGALHAATVIDGKFDKSPRLLHEALTSTLSRCDVQLAEVQTIIHYVEALLGTIHAEVQVGHLARHGEELLWLRSFQSAFDITWASSRKAHGSDYSVYFLRPTEHTKETFGFDLEIMLVYSKYNKLEARTLQSLEQFINDDPARGRVDRLFVALVSEANDPGQWMDEYTSTNEARTIAVFSASELRVSAGDAWHVRKVIASQVFTRDLFDFRLPLERDTYFFGRTALLHKFKDGVARGENRGLFGLRKTGKTSFLYKLRREFQEDGNTISLFYDCKSPSVRQRTWSELLTKVITDLSKESGISIELPKDSRFLSETLSELIMGLPHHKKVAIIFDEVEYISYFSKTDEHWRADYLPFWQSIWAAQSETRKLSAILAGVSPQLVEVDKIEKIQNPLFGIVPYDYLTGLSQDEVRRMLQTLGRRMGIKFQPQAADIFMSEYGGHPLLCRLAASFTYKQFILEGKSLPINVSTPEIEKQKSLRDEGLVFYCGHVISELRDFYPDEYQVFELLACGEVANYLDFTTLPEYKTHLESYGLVTMVDHSPNVAIPVVGTHVALEVARREGRKTIQKLIPVSGRLNWIKKRTQDINAAFSDLQRAGRSEGAPLLFGPNNYPESHRFMNVSAVEDLDALQSFLNVCNRCFVESIEIYGKSIERDSYFWVDIKRAYPRLHHSLHRIKVYRHNEFHLQLNDSVDDVYRKFLRQDLENRDPANVSELAFTLQQAVLDSLWNNLQVELSRYGR